MRKILTLLSLAFVLFALACAPAADEAGVDDDATADAAAEGSHAGDEGDEHEARHAADQSDERAAWSKPFEVYEFFGVEEGDTVVDLLAGGGYNTTRVAEVVGSNGKVIVERARPEFKSQVESGEIDLGTQVEFIDWVDALEPGTVDVVLAIRAYHLFPDVPAQLATLYEALKPGGVVGVVEIRLNQETGHDQETHRVGEQTVIGDFDAAGFEYVDSSDILRVEGDDYSIFVPEGKQRYQTDRMLLKFQKPQA